MNIRVTARGFKNNHTMLDEIVGNIDDEISSVLHRIGEDIVAEARHNVQQNRSIDSGTLISSIRILSEDDTSITVGTDEKYAEYIEYGRGPVNPKDPDGWLHWIDKNTGKDVFAKHAKATEPRPFLQPAVEKHTRRIRDVYVEENEHFIKKRANSFIDTELLD